MKLTYGPLLWTSLLIVLALGISQTSTAQNMSVNATGATPDSTAMLDVSSTTQGFLMPRMTGAQRNAIANPAFGLMVLQSDGNKGVYMYDTAGPGLWRYILDSAGVVALINATETGDTLGNHQMTQNLETGGFYISNDGGNEGLSVAANGQLTATPATTGAGNLALATNGDIRTVGIGTGVYFTNTAIGITGNNGNSGDMRLWTGGNSRMRIAANGNVSIDAPSSGTAFAVTGITHVDTLNVNGAFTLPSTDGTNGQVMTTDGSGNVAWASTGSNVDTSRIADADNDTKIQVEESNDEDFIRFDMAGTEFFRMDSGRFEVVNTGNSVFIGENAGSSDDFTDNRNVFIGTDAAGSNTSGALNVAVGYEAGANTTNASQNTAVGYQALNSNVTGGQNVAIGSFALHQNTTGNNTAIGDAAAQNNTTGTDNVAIGREANLHNQQGSNNTIIGTGAGKGASNHNKEGNVFLGYNAGFNETGSNKLYIENSDTNAPLIYGNFASDSVIINGSLSTDDYTFPTSDGTNGQVMTTDGAGNVAWASTGFNVDTTRIADSDNDTKIQVEESNDEDIIRFDLGGSEQFRMTDGRLEVYNANNVFIGPDAGSSFNTSGSSLNPNVAIGHDAMKNNVTALNIVAVGHEALLNATAGDNTAVGALALKGNTSGFRNVAFGTASSRDNTTGDENAAFGWRSLSDITTGDNNVGFGASTMGTNTTGSNNTAIGTAAGYNTDGSGNVFLGFRAGFNEIGSNKLYIENSNSSTPLIYGNFASDSVIINGSLSTDDYTFPTSDGTNGQVMTTDGAGNVSWATGGGTGYWENDANGIHTDSSIAIGGVSNSNFALTVHADSLQKFGILQWGNPDFFNTMTMRSGGGSVDHRVSMGMYDTSGVDNRFTVGTNPGSGWTNPLQIELGAPNQSIYVDSVGQVVIGGDNGEANFTVIDEATAANMVGIFRAPNLPNVSAAAIAIGKESSEKNQAEIAYIHRGTGNDTNSLAFGFNNVQPFVTITAGQLMGVGTQFPLNKFDVRGDAMIGNGFTPSTANTANNLNLIVGQDSLPWGNGISFFENNTGFGMHMGYNGIGTGPANKINFYGSSYDTLMTITNAGNIGIGTDVPDSLLDVAGGASIDRLNINSAFTLPTSDGTNGQVMITDGSGNLSWAANGSGSSPWTVSGANLLRDTGNVAIGQALVVDKFQVHGTNSVYPFYSSGYFNTEGTTAGDNRGIFVTSDGVNTGINTGVLVTASNATTNRAIYASSGDVIVNDRVGINTTSPTEDLDVAGNATIDTLNINSAFTLPSTDGTNGQVMTTDGSGNVSWSSSSGSSLWTNSGSNTYLSTGDVVGVGTSTPHSDFIMELYQNGGGSAKGGLFLNNSVNGNTRKIGVFSKLDDGGNNSKIAFKSLVEGKNSGNDTLASYFSEIANENASDLGFGLYSTFVNTTGTNYGVYSANEDYNYFSNNVGIANTTPDSLLDVAGGATIDFLNINSAFTLPSTDGINGQVMTTDGSGNVSWATAAGDGDGIYDGSGSLSGNTVVTGGANTLSFSSTATNGFSVDDSTLSVDAANNYLGLGTASPDNQLHMYSEETGGNKIDMEFVSNSGAPGLNFKRAHNGKTIVSDGDNIGFIDFYGYDGTTYQQAARIRMKIDGTPGAGDMPGRLYFETTPDGSSTPVERMRIQSDGNIGIGTTSPDSLLDVAGGATIDRLNINSAFTLPTTDGTNGQVMTTNGSGVVSWSNAGSGDGDGIYDGSGSLSGNTVVAGGANTLDFTTTATDGFSIDGTTFSVDGANNRVGIGTNSPAVPLQVFGTTHINGPFTGTPAGNVNSSGFTFGREPTNNIDPVFTIAEDGNDTRFLNFGVGGFNSLITWGEGDLYFRNDGVEGDFGGTTRMRIKANGDIVISDHVGINTSSPTEELEVVGTAIIDTLNVNSAFTLPSADGTNGQVMTTNGSGVVSWSNAGSGDGDGIYDGSGSLSGNTVVTGGANTLDFTTTATDGFSVDGTTFSVDGANDQVGIGTSSPLGSLQIEGTKNVTIGDQSVLTGLHFSSSTPTWNGMVWSNTGGNARYAMRYAETQDKIVLSRFPHGGGGHEHQVVIDSMGRMGVGEMGFGGGTQNPRDVFDVRIHEDSTGGINVGDPDNILAQLGDGGSSNDNGILRLWNQSSTETVRLTAGTTDNWIMGDIGIGTTSPSEKLDVVGTATIDTLNINSAFTLPSADGTNGQVMTTDGSGNVSWSTAGSGDGDGIYDGSGSLSGNTVVTGGANTLDFTTTATDGFTVDGTTFSVDGANNRVGIGTAAPASPLHVVRNTTGGAILGAHQAGDGDYINIYGDNTFGYASLVLSDDEDISTASTSFWEIQHRKNGGDHDFRIVNNDNTQGTGTGDIALTIKMDNEFVGIGTTTPQSKLEVSGGGRFDTLFVDGAFQLPTADGTNGQVMTTDGSGNVSWAAATATLSGGSANKLARWSSSSALDTSLIQDDGNSIGINTTPSTFQLVEAETNSSTYTVGIRGDHTLNSSTITRGVWGSSSSTDKNNSAGVYGSANNGAYAVYGQSGSSDAGVVVINGYNSAGGANENYGVKGQTSSSNAGSAGLYGFAFHGGNALLAESNARVIEAEAYGTRTAGYNAVEINNFGTSTTASIDKTAVDIQSTGAWTGTTAKNVGLNVNVAGGTTNYAALFAGGNVGIGTSNPDSLLDVAGAATIDVLNINSAFTLPTTDGTNGQVMTTDGSGNLSWSSAAGDGDGIYDGSGSLTGNTVVTQGANTLDFTTTASDGFSVDGTTFSVDGANNRVGLGTASPSAQLHLVTGGIGAVTLDGSNGAGTWLALGNSSSGGKYYQLISSGPSNGEGTGKLLFGVGASANGVQNVSMILDSNKLGIGVANPQYSLEALQGIRAGTNNFDGQFRLYSEQGGTDYEVVINPNAAMTQTTTYTMPPDDGDANEVLTTDGSGALSWAVPSDDGDWTVSGGLVYNATDRFAVGTSSIPGSYFSEIQSPAGGTYQIGFSMDHDYTGAAQTFGVLSSISNAGTGQKHGFYTAVQGNAGQTNTIHGSYNQMTGGNTEEIVGTYNMLLSNGTGDKTGTYNDVTANASQGGDLYGSYNDITTAGSGYTTYGNRTEISGSGTGSKYGDYVLISEPAAQSSAVYGSYTNVIHAGNNLSYGARTLVNGTGDGNTTSGLFEITNTGDGTHTGVETFVTSPSTSAARLDGIYQELSHDGAGRVTGMYVSIDNDGTGARAGVDLDVASAAGNSADAFGTQANLDIDGSGDAYGSYVNYTGSSGAGTHYGAYTQGEDFNYFSGDVGIGTTSTANKLQVEGNIAPNTDNTYDLGNAALRWDDVYATNGTIQTSDKRFKKNIADLNYGLDDVMALRPVSYNWKNDSTGEDKIGFVAQEVLEIVPEVVNIGEDSLQTLGMRYADMVPLLVKAIQDQQAEIESLRNQNAKHEMEKASLENRLNENSERLTELTAALNLLISEIQSDKQQNGTLKAKKDE